MKRRIRSFLLIPSVVSICFAAGIAADEVPAKNCDAVCQRIVKATTDFVAEIEAEGGQWEAPSDPEKTCLEMCRGDRIILPCAMVGRDLLDINYCTKGTDEVVDTQSLLLILASARGDLTEVLELIPEADVGFERFGATALSKAASEGHLEVIETLLKAGADIDQLPASGQMGALCSAALHQQEEALRFLLEAGADPTLETNGGWSVVTGCDTGESPTITRYLQEAAARKTSASDPS